MKRVRDQAHLSRRLVAAAVIFGAVGAASITPAGAQVGLPPDQQPSKGSLWDSIFGPLVPLLSGAWWVVLHIVLPIGLIGGVAGMVFAGISGNKPAMARARGVIMSVPMALFAVSVAVLVSNWIISNY
jgi:hypothetical protein